MDKDLSAVAPGSDHRAARGTTASRPEWTRSYFRAHPLQMFGAAVPFGVATIVTGMGLMAAFLLSMSWVVHNTPHWLHVAGHVVGTGAVVVVCVAFLLGAGLWSMAKLGLIDDLR